MKEELRVQLLLNANNTNTNHQLHTNHHHKLNEVDDGKPWQAAAMSSLSSSITPTLLLSVFVAVLGSFSCGFTMAYSSPVQAQIMKELNLSTADYSLFGSILNFGGIFGAIVCGWLADYLGRKHVLRLTVLIYIFGWLSIATGQSAWLLDLGRWLLGFSMIIGNYAVPVYIAEFAPKNLRGGFVSLHALMTAVGASSVFLTGLVISWRTLAFIGTIPSLVQIVGLFFIPESPRWLDAWSLDVGRLSVGCAMGLTVYVVPVYIAEITPRNLRGGSVLLHQLMLCCGIALAYILGLVTSWRVLSLIGAVPCIIQFLGLFFIPESPRWLVKVGHDKGCESTLRRLRGKKFDIAHEAAQIKDCAETIDHVSQDSFFNVFQMKYAFALTISLGLMALASFGGTNGILFYATTTFESAGVSSKLGTIAMALIQLPPTFLGVFLMDKSGRRPLLLFSVTGMGTACLSVAMSFLMKDYGWMPHFSPYLALFGILIFSAAYPVGMGGIPFIIMSEIFPINVKGAAGSLATIVSWSSAWVVSYSFNFMMDWSSSGTFFIFTSINVLALIFVAKLVPETKGRTLEEIQESLTHTLY